MWLVPLPFVKRESIDSLCFFHLPPQYPPLLILKQQVSFSAPSSVSREEKNFFFWLLLSLDARSSSLYSVPFFL